MVVEPKQDGDIRMCTDMRRANEAIIRERHYIPTVEEVMYDMNGSTVFSKLDMRSGFHQIELDVDSREITTFITHQGLYVYKRLMFGLASAPEMYQKIIRDVLIGISKACNIADDIVVHGKDTEEHDDMLEKTLTRFRECGLTLNGKKCVFRTHKITFFGHDLTDEGVRLNEEKVAAVVKAESLTTSSEVLSFLCLVQFSAKFFPDFSQTAQPLWKLTKKNAEFKWGKEEDESFQRLKDLITRRETLKYFNAEAQTRIVADAGPEGLGAVLTQNQEENWVVLSYASRNLSDVEKRYSQTEKEALALVWACERFNIYVFGRKFELETDHKALECIYTPQSKPSARIERWVLRLQSYDYKVVYRPGKGNIADALSRLNHKEPKDRSGETVDEIRCIAESLVPAALSMTEIEEESARDDELSVVRECIKSNNWEKCTLTYYLTVRNELCLYGSLVLRGTRIVIPKSLRGKVLNQAHEGHQGFVKTKMRLRQKVWWPKIDADAAKRCKSCRPCQVVGPSAPPEPMARTEMPTGAWQDLCMGLHGPYPDGTNLLAVQDYYSRFPEVVFMKSTTTDKILDALDEMFARFGFPFSMKSDNGPQFSGRRV